MTTTLSSTGKLRGRPREFDLPQALDQALQVFWRNGYEGASIADLTAAMGINPPSLYAAFGCFFAAGVAGLALAAVTSWWLVAVGAACIAAAWFYTGGPRPYGYHGLGEVFVFACFGVVAVAGTAYVQMKTLSWLGLAASVPAGLLACALLMVNNLRDIGTDTLAGKRTLAVMLGDARSRVAYVLTLLVPFGIAALLAFFRPFTLLTVLTLPLTFYEDVAIPALRFAESDRARDGSDLVGEDAGPQGRGERRTAPHGEAAAVVAIGRSGRHRPRHGAIGRERP